MKECFNRSDVPSNQVHTLKTERMVLEPVTIQHAEAFFEFLRTVLKVSEIKAWSDSRNIASHRLALKMGMDQVDFIKDADHFKGSTSDEFVFSIK